MERNTIKVGGHAMERAEALEVLEAVAWALGLFGSADAGAVEWVRDELAKHGTERLAGARQARPACKNVYDSL